MAIHSIEEFIRQLLTEHYALGEVTHVRKIKAGDTNQSFLAYCMKEGKENTWYVRQYNPAQGQQDIIYEHAFESWLNTKIDSDIQTLLPVQTVEEKTWVEAEYDGYVNFYAVFNIITGREPYSWEFNNLSDEAFVSCAEITAKFHAWGYGFEPPEGIERQEIPLEEQLKKWQTDLPASVAEKEQNPEVFRRYTDYLKPEVDFLLGTIRFCEDKLEQYKDKLKKCITHKDLNPGNVMFDEKDRVCAVFDLDWVNKDYRIYDIAWMGYQAIASWDTKSWGTVPFDRMERFLKIYNETMLKYQCPLGELTDEEYQFLPVMMIIGALKVITDFICYEDHTHDAYRVFVNTWRFVESIHYMMEHLGKAETIERV